jgi:hypothetical protein
MNADSGMAAAVQCAGPVVQKGREGPEVHIRAYSRARSLVRHAKNHVHQFFEHIAFGR